MHRLENIVGALGFHESQRQLCSTSFEVSGRDDRGHSAVKPRSGVDVVVVGGAVCDVAAKSDALEKDTLHTSQTGVSWEKDGGVGRNIAEGCARLSLRCAFITAVGADARGEALKHRLASSGVDTSLVHTAAGARTATYQCVLDRNGGLIAAVADMQVFTHITPELVAEAHCLKSLRAPAVLCLDGNADVPTIDASVRAVHPEVVVLFEPTSVPKSTRCLRCLDAVDIITPNASELFAISEGVSSQGGVTVEGSGFASIDAAAEYLFDNSGLLAIAVTMGEEGVVLFFSPCPADPAKAKKWHRLVSGEGAARSSPSTAGAKITKCLIPAAPLRAEDIVDVTGAGDSLVAGSLAGLLRGMSLEQSIALIGTKAACSTLKSDRSVSASLFRDSFSN